MRSPTEAGLRGDGRDARAEVGDVTRAVVRAAGVATRYARVGGGPPVLLLGLSAGERLHPLARRLSERVRVVVPERWSGPGVDEDEDPPLPLSGWLGPFLDGLGVQRAPLIATSALAHEALAFALLEPARIDRLVLLHGGVVGAAEAATDPPTALDERLEPSGLSLLVLAPGPDAVGGDPASTAERILSFLG